jgi:hypothetical protein
MLQRLSSAPPRALIGGPPLLHNHPRLTALNHLRAPTILYQVPWVHPLRCLKGGSADQEVGSPASTSSLPFVRTNGQSSENIGPAY